ncbi:hydrogenase subunit MbhD domain-containing protein [Ornithinimicrobium sp. W1665]|uniref:hydrogenase subunit MbhD domain-containing protein n=1 Tax=Ornithinimicrobium sp. W1665 TaxID=3416666 RepID=UPI003D6B9908
MRGTDRVALEVTGFLQRGSLPVLLGTIVAVIVVVPTVTMFTRQVSWPSVRFADSAAQVATAVLVVSAAYLATRARRRLRAVFLVGVTGYGTAYLYLLHGAPDLALTQLLVETVTLVVLVLVLRRLSGRFPDDPTRTNRRVRALIGTAAAGVVGTAAVIAAGSRVQEPPPARVWRNGRSTTAGATTSSTSSSSTCAPGTRWVSCRSSWPPRPAWPA